MWRSTSLPHPSACQLTAAATSAGAYFFYGKDTKGACEIEPWFFNPDYYSIAVSADGKTLTRVRFNCTDATCNNCGLALDNVPLDRCLAVEQSGFQSLSITAGAKACIGGALPTGGQGGGGGVLPPSPPTPPQTPPSPSPPALPPHPAPAELWLVMMAQLYELNFCSPMQSEHMTIVKLGAADGR